MEFMFQCLNTSLSVLLVRNDFRNLLKLFTSHLLSSSFLSSAQIMMLDMLTPCFSFLIDDATTGHLYQRKMIRTAPYRCFYVIVHTCCVCTWKGFNKYFRVFYHPYLMTNLDFSFFSPFGLSFLWASAVIIFCGLLLLSNDNSSSYDYHVLDDLLRCVFLLFILLAFFFLFFFLFCFVTLLQKHPGVFLFLLSLLSMAFMFVVVCNYCGFLVLLPFAKKTHGHFWKDFLWGNL